MLFVHFTPIKNVKHIKRMGIRPKKGKIYLFPMIRGMKTLINVWSWDGWWKDRGEGRWKRMAKIIVRLPPYEKVKFGDWATVAFKEPITVKELGKIIKKELEEIKNKIEKKDFPELKIDYESLHKIWTEFSNFFSEVFNITDFKEYVSMLNENYKKEYPQALSIDYWFGGNAVIYEKHIPPKWIVNIFMYPRSDWRTKQYRREKEKKRIRKLLTDSFE